jgi:phosphoglycerol transferase
MTINNPHLPIKGIAQYILTALIALIFLILVFHLWSIELQFPILGYQGDVLFQASQIKSIVETGWIYTNPSLGAPFRATFYDFPTSDSLHYIIINILSFFTRDPFVIFNTYYLCGFPLAALSALFLLKKLSLPFYVALPGAISFAFLPFHFMRYQHLYYTAYFMIPLGLSAILEAVDGNLNMISWDQQRRIRKINLRKPKIWFYFLVCILTASSGVYYAYFIAFIGLISAVLCLFLITEEDRINRSISCIVLVFFLAITAITNGAPSFLYTFLNGKGTEPVAIRTAREAEYYGLKITQMLLPSPIHRFPKLASITQSYSKTAPIVNENSTASLGLIGTIGFLYSLIVLFRQQRKNMMDDYLSFINISCILLATIGGFGSLIAFFVLPSIRCYNRISVIIGLVSIALFCRLVQRVLKIFKLNGSTMKEKNNVIFFTGLSIFILTVVFIDQCFIPNFVKNYQLYLHSYNNDRRFAGEIEKILPEGAMVFQLPFMSFPENGPINNMVDYDQIRPYLHTSDLRWSYGDTVGRMASDWNQTTANLPTEQMMQRLAATGFSGIYIDRFGYLDAEKEIEEKIRPYVKIAPIVSDDQRFVLYDIRTYVNDYRSIFDDNQWRSISAMALKPPSKITPSGECWSIEGEASDQWIWCGNRGELVVVNHEAKDRNIILNLSISTGTGEDALLFIKFGSRRGAFKIGRNPKLIQIKIPMKAGQISQKITLKCNAHPFNPGSGDTRELVFLLRNFYLISEDASDLP